MNIPVEGPPRDIWSLGIILYKLSFGSFPFEAKELNELKKKIIHSEPNYLSTEVSNKLKSLIMLMLNKDPSMRIGTNQILTHSWIKERYYTSLDLKSVKRIIRKIGRK